MSTQQTCPQCGMRSNGGYSHETSCGLLDGDAWIAEQAAIDAAYPTRSGRHDLYAEAIRMVGAKHSKGALVDLVNWLLHQRTEPVERCAFCAKTRAEVAYLIASPIPIAGSVIAICDECILTGGTLGAERVKKT